MTLGMKGLKLLMIGILLTSCDPSDNRLNIKNNSSDPIYYTYSSEDELDGKDIRIGINIDLSEASGKTPDNYYLISPKSTANAALTSQMWEAIANESKDGKVYFFFFLKDTLTKYGWEEIVIGTKYAGKASYTINEMKKRGWTINYPAKK